MINKNPKKQQYKRLSINETIATLANLYLFYEDLEESEFILRTSYTYPSPCSALRSAMEYLRQLQAERARGRTKRGMSAVGQLYQNYEEQKQASERGERMIDGQGVPNKPFESMDSELIARATSARDNAFAKLSGHKVGAALLGGSGAIYVGCNVEFGNYSNTLHAEEVALGAAIVNGEREFKAIAIVTDASNPVWPCGMCLQSLYELAGSRLRVIAAYRCGQDTKLLGELFPYPCKSTRRHSLELLQRRELER